MSAKKDKASKKKVLEQSQQSELPELKSKVLVKDRKFVRVIYGEDCLASVPIRYVLEELYEKTNKRATWENFFKKWRPTILKMEGSKWSEIEKEVLGK